MISDIKTGVEFVGFLMVNEKPSIREGKKKYGCLKLGDKTGTLECRIWDLPTDIDIQTFNVGDIVKVMSRATEFNNEIQLSIGKIRLAEDSEFDIANFLATSPFDPVTMLDELEEILTIYLLSTHRYPEEQQGYVTTLWDLCQGLLTRVKPSLLKAPAAKAVHHAYLGGLLEHTLSMMKTSILLAPKYDLNLPLLLAACLFHDIGKVYELSYARAISYSTIGSLVGHVGIGLQQLSSVYEELCSISSIHSDAAFEDLSHLIATHHGEIEWGATTLPKTKEAYAFHLIDMLDSKMAIIDNASKSVNSDGWTQFVKPLNTALFVRKAIK